jgi:TGF-beta receptor type-1
MLCIIGGTCEDYQLPYYNMVMPDPKIEEMKKLVTIDRKRPHIPNQWLCHEVRRIAVEVTTLSAFSAQIME